MCPNDSISASVTRLRAMRRQELRIPTWPTQPSGVSPALQSSIDNNLGSSLGSHWQTQAGKQGKQRQQETGKGRRRKWVKGQAPGAAGAPGPLSAGGWATPGVCCAPATPRLRPGAPRQTSPQLSLNPSLSTQVYMLQKFVQIQKELKIKKPTSATHDLKRRIKEKSTNF